MFILLIPIFILIVSILCASYFRATTCDAGSPNYLTVTPANNKEHQLRGRSGRPQSLRKEIVIVEKAEEKK